MTRILIILSVVILPVFARATHNFEGYKNPPEAVLREKLTPEQYAVTQEGDTEPPFHNAYWDNHAPGIYVDIVSGEPLFASFDKFDSKTGWPSFTRPLVERNVMKIVERSSSDWEYTLDFVIFGARTEVRSMHANSHLGHVFNDGPKPTGLRYCIDSASLRFIPAAALEKNGYGEFSYLFPSSPK